MGKATCQASSQCRFTPNPAFLCKSTALALNVTTCFCSPDSGTCVDPSVVNPLLSPFGSYVLSAVFSGIPFVVVAYLWISYTCCTPADEHNISFYVVLYLLVNVVDIFTDLHYFCRSYYATDMLFLLAVLFIALVPFAPYVVLFMLRGTFSSAEDAVWPRYGWPLIGISANELAKLIDAYPIRNDRGSDCIELFSWLLAFALWISLSVFAIAGFYAVIFGVLGPLMWKSEIMMIPAMNAFFVGARQSGVGTQRRNSQHHDGTLGDVFDPTLFHVRVAAALLLHSLPQLILQVYNNTLLLEKGYSFEHVWDLSSIFSIVSS